MIIVGAGAGLIAQTCHSEGWVVGLLCRAPLGGEPILGFVISGDGGGGRIAEGGGHRDYNEVGVRQGPRRAKALTESFHGDVHRVAKLRFKKNIFSN